MFAARYFGPRPFATRYFCKVGAAAFLGALIVGYAGRDQLTTDKPAQLRGQMTRNLG